MYFSLHLSFLSLLWLPTHFPKVAARNPCGFWRKSHLGYRGEGARGGEGGWGFALSISDHITTSPLHWTWCFLVILLNMGYHYLSMAIEKVCYLVILFNMSSPWHVHWAWGSTTCPWRWRKDWVWKQCSTARPPSARSEETKIFFYVHLFFQLNIEKHFHFCNEKAFTFFWFK